MAVEPPQGGRQSSVVKEVMVMALVRTDPFREVDRLFQQLLAGPNGARSWAMPMDAYRKDDSFLIRVDLPGVSPESVDLTVEENVLTIKAGRPAPPFSDVIVSVITVRPNGHFVRQFFFSKTLATENIRAEYEAG